MCTAKDRRGRAGYRPDERWKNGPGGDGVTDAVTARALMFCTGEMIPERSLVECEGRTYIVLACRAARGFGQEHLEVTMQ